MKDCFEMENLIKSYLSFKFTAYKGFADTVCCIFRQCENKRAEIFDFAKNKSVHLSDVECLEKISEIVGFSDN